MTERTASERGARLTAKMKLLQLQAPGMKAIATFSGSGHLADALIGQIKRITKQGGTQLRQVDTDLMRSSRRDCHLEAISLGAAFQQGEFTAGFQPIPNQAIRLGQRSPNPAQQGMGPLNHIRLHYKRCAELKP